MQGLSTAEWNSLAACVRHIRSITRVHPLPLQGPFCLCRRGGRQARLSQTRPYLGMLSCIWRRGQASSAQQRSRCVRGSSGLVAIGLDCSSKHSIAAAQAHLQVKISQRDDLFCMPGRGEEERGSHIVRCRDMERHKQAADPGEPILPLDIPCTAYCPLHLL